MGLSRSIYYLKKQQQSFPKSKNKCKNIGKKEASFLQSLVHCLLSSCSFSCPFTCVFDFRYKLLKSFNLAVGVGFLFFFFSLAIDRMMEELCYFLCLPLRSPKNRGSIKQQLAFFCPFSWTTFVFFFFFEKHCYRKSIFLFVLFCY